MLTVLGTLLSALTLVGCAHTLSSSKTASTKPSASVKNFDKDEDAEGYSKKLIEKLEREKSELEVQNSMLMRALKEKKKVIHKLPKGEVVQQFPEFEELIFDQAKTAYRQKDEERLQEAIRIMRINQPGSQTVESMFFWLAQIQEGKGLNSQALVTYNEFIKNFPQSEYAPQALYLKGKLYEKLNLKPQALKIYEDIRKNYPHSRERHFVESKLGNDLKPQSKKK